MFEIEEVTGPIAKIKVMGVGGGGCNAVNSMADANIFGVELIAVNTDKQHLDFTQAHMKVQIGETLTKGLGAGGDPEIGMSAVVESSDALMASIEGSDMLFITAGMGGGTGSGACPVIAGIAKDMNILTVGVVTTPFFYEGKDKAFIASTAITDLRKRADAVIVISNDKLIDLIDKDTHYEKAFLTVDNVLRQAVQGITDIVLIPGKMNIDFADLKAILSDAGKTVIGMGHAKGDGAVISAIKKAISNPLFDMSIEGARAAILNITGDLSLSFKSIHEVTSMLYDLTDERIKLKLGLVKNEDMRDEVSVTIVATGFEAKPEKAVLPDVPIWSPRVPVKQGRETQRILSKELPPSLEPQPIKKIVNIVEKKEQVEPPEIIAPEKQAIKFSDQEDLYDVPTFLRKK